MVSKNTASDKKTEEQERRERRGSDGNGSDGWKARRIVGKKRNGRSWLW